MYTYVCICVYTRLIYSPGHSYTHTHRGREKDLNSRLVQRHAWRKHLAEHFIPFGIKYMSNFGRQGGASEGVSEGASGP